MDAILIRTAKRLSARKKRDDAVLARARKINAKKK